MFADACKRRVAVALDAPNQTAQLLEIFPGLQPSRAAQLEVVRGFPQNGVHQIGGRHPVDPCEPPADAFPQARQHRVVLGRKHRRRVWHTRLRDRGGERGTKLHHAGVGQSHDARPQECGGPQIGGRIGEAAHERHDILNLVGFEESEPFVDVGRHASALEGRLELAMALAGAEQDRHVGGSGLAHDAGLAIANRRRGQQANYLVRHSIGRLTDGLGDDEAQRTGGWWLVAGDWSS